MKNLLNFQYTKNNMQQYYGQSQEDKYILDYFKDFTGTLLSIGENNGKDLSNSLSLIEKGWNATLIEPSPTVFPALCELHKDRPNVYCHRVAIADKEGQLDFFESGTHLKNGDQALLSSLDEKEIVKWRASTEFNCIKVDVITFKTLLKKNNYQHFDFISIDAEGYDLAILEQMNLLELKCKMICIEHNSQPAVLSRIMAICRHFGLQKEILKNGENIIMAM